MSDLYNYLSSVEHKQRFFRKITISASPYNARWVPQSLHLKNTQMKKRKDNEGYDPRY